MRSKAIAIMAAIALLIGSSVAYLLLAGPAEVPEATSSRSAQPATEADGERSPGSTSDEARAGSYVEYSSTALDQAEGVKLLFFHAPWCPQCRALEADIKATGVPAGVTILKVDYDSNQALRQKYGITIQTSFAKVDDDGNLIQKYVAYEEPTLAAVETNLLR